MRRTMRVAVAAALGLTVALYGCAGSASDGEAAVEEQAQTADEEVDEEAVAKAEAQAKAAAEAEAAAAKEAEREAARGAAQGEGLSVFVGTVRVMGGLDLCDYESVQAEMVGPVADVEDSTYVVLVLDETAHVVGEGADGSPREGDADHISIGRVIPAFDFVEDSASSWYAYDGQRVCVAGNPWFQTDVSLPFAPRMYDARLLYVED